MNVIKFITSTAKASVPVIKAHSPKILLVAGLVGIAGGTVWACYNTATEEKCPIPSGRVLVLATISP